MPKRLFVCLATLTVVGCSQPKGPLTYADEVEAKLASRVTRLDTSKSPPELPLPKNPPKTVDLAKVRAESAKIKTLVIQDIVVGSGPMVTDGENVSIHYVGVLPDGFVFDTSYKNEGQPYTFKYETKHPVVIAGWMQGLAGMRVGGHRKLVVPATLAYGANPPPGPLPPNAALIFDLQLMYVGGPG